MPTTALIAGGLTAAGSVAGSLISSSAASKASSQQVAEQQQALDQQKQMFGVAQGALNPFITSGQSVIPTLQNLLTPGTSAATLAQMPGFQFASQYGTKAATNALAARTGPSAGPLATAISQYNNGLATNQYQNTVGNLQNFVNTGANAAGNLAGGAISSGNAMAGTFGNIGNALASGTLGTANAISGGINGASGGISNALLYNQLFGKAGGGGIYSGISGTLADKGLSNAVGTGQYNYLDAAAG